MKKFLTRLLLFIAVVIVINIILNITLPIAGDERFDSRYQYLQQNIAKYNTLFFGSSRTLRHMIPARFDSLNKAHGITTHAFNLGTPANKSLESYTQYERFLNDYAKTKSKHIKYAFLEIHPLDAVVAKNVTTRKGYYWVDGRNLKFVLSYFKSKIQSRRGWLDMCDNYFFAFVLHTVGFNYLNLEKENPDTELNMGNNHDGYISLEDEIKGSKSEDRIHELKFIREKFEADTNSLHRRAAIATEAFSKRVKNQSAAPAVHLQRLQYLIKKSEQLGIKLSFVVQPRLSGYREVFALEDALPANSIIEIANPAIYPQLYALKNAYDVGHMKYSGAVIVTDILSEKFIINHTK